MNSVVSAKMYAAGVPLMKSGKIRRIERSLLFNVWIALVQYFVLNREQFSPRLPILKEKGDMLIKHFLGLVRS